MEASFHINRSFTCSRKPFLDGARWGTMPSSVFFNAHFSFFLSSVVFFGIWLAFPKEANSCLHQWRHLFQWLDCFVLIDWSKLTSISRQRKTNANEKGASIGAHELALHLNGPSVRMLPYLPWPSGFHCFKLDRFLRKRPLAVMKIEISLSCSNLQ